MRTDKSSNDGQKCQAASADKGHDNHEDCSDKRVSISLKIRFASRGVAALRGPGGPGPPNNLANSKN